MCKILDKINTPKDLKALSRAELVQLCEEIRQQMLLRLSATGGHVGSNLAVIEATVALHYVFNSPVDKIIFDVSHQCYTHKLLTGRKAAYIDAEKFSSVSGFTNPVESEHDIFSIGHTSTAISLACGLAKGRDVRGESYKVIALVGDGALSGGEAFEGLNNAAALGSNIILIINDNDMSIAENHGGLYKNLKQLRDTDGKSECNLFKSMGLDYVFVKDGNDIDSLITAFEQVKDSTYPVVVHICTQKGKGYKIAEENKENWHYCGPFNLETGKSDMSQDGGEDYSSMTADILLKKMKEDKTVVGITSATPTVFGFTEDKRKEAGSQFVDVGIAEETAVALASGIAKSGGKPVYGVYSTFIQRTYDQLSQDLCINNSPATLLVYWASVYGMNDVTHLGIYDIPMMSNIPNLVYLAPTTKEEYLAMLDWSIEQNDHPVAIRVPISVVSDGKKVTKDFSKLNKYEVTQNGSKIAIAALGSFYSVGAKTAEIIENKTGVKPTLINPIYITGTDDKLLEQLKENHDIVITVEDGVLDGGFGEKIARFYGNSDVKVLNYGLKKEFLDRYNPEEIVKANRLTPEQIAEDVCGIIG